MASISEEMLKALGAYLKAQVSALRHVVYEFPEPTQVLVYPAISLHAATTNYTNFPPTVYAQTVTDVTNQATVQYIVGGYDWTLQLDLWTRTKEERHTLYDALFTALNSQLPTLGLTLPMVNYFGGVLCHYDFTGYSVADDAGTSERKEWRATLNLIANAKAILAKTERMIVVTGLDFDTSDNIN